MIEKVNKTIEKYNLLENGERIVVAHSGGPDSTALLKVLVPISQKLNLTLIVAHFNHGLRGGESNADEKFSRDLAKKMGLFFCSGKMGKKNNNRGISPEDFYRRQRYNFLEKVAKDHRAQKIALGHNLNDQAETVLLNILRGSGLEGLKGFLPKREGKIIRPLIEISRPEIISFLKKSGLSYCQDNSNKSKMHLRNKIRAELIPYLRKKYNPKIEENLAQMAEILRAENDLIEQHVAKVMQSSTIKYNGNNISFEIDFVNLLPDAVRWRLFKNILENLNPTKNGVFFAHIELLDNLARKCESGKRISLPMGMEVRREYDKLILEKRRASLKKIKYEYVMDIPGSLYIRERGFKVNAKIVKKEKVNFGEKNKIYLDFDKIEKPLIIRNRRDGDWFQPLGMTGRQKIKSFFIDHKIPRHNRDKILILVDGLSVIGIENMHLSDRVKITTETKKVLKLEITNS